jgi:hypothetical protein
MSIVKAVLSLRTGSEFSLSDTNDYSTITWHTEGIVPPTAEEVVAEEARLVQEAASKKVNAEAKLAVLGLTTDDIKALFS